MLLTVPIIILDVFSAFMLILLSIVPLIVPETPPLPDLPGHMARYAVELYLSQSLSLQQFFEFHWTIVGNLGVDLLIEPDIGAAKAIDRLLGVTHQKELARLER